jgi:hypothetical protein
LRFDDQAVSAQIHAISAARAQTGVCDIHATSSTARFWVFYRGTRDDLLWLVIGRSLDLTEDNRSKLNTLRGMIPRVDILTYDDLLSSTKTTLQNSSARCRIRVQRQTSITCLSRSDPACVGRARKALHERLEHGGAIRVPGDEARDLSHRPDRPPSEVDVPVGVEQENRQ